MGGLSDSYTRHGIANLSKTARNQSRSFLAPRKKPIQAKTWIQDSPAGRSYVIVLPTQGCSWALSNSGGCTVCGYLEDTYLGKANIDSTQKHFEGAMKSIPYPPPITIKLFNSGSFFDEKEIPTWLQQEILSSINEIKGVERLIVESRPEFITSKALEIVDKALPTKNLTIAIGLETSNDIVRRDCINKGFSLAEFERAVELISDYGLEKKAYLLLKPPFLTESEAISDCVSSVLYANSIGINEVSINPINIQKNTLLEKLWRKGSYRPPWLWSLLWVVQQILKHGNNFELLCEPVGGGTSRGIHNCGQCDKIILSEIRHKATRDWKSIDSFDCSCLELWYAVIENDSSTYALDFF
ncbi:MAG: archaeosine biosynthesis radical SAM protein RaSEA [Candidatus Hodarchaeota archaeon]